MENFKRANTEQSIKGRKKNTDIVDRKIMVRGEDKIRI